MDTAQHCEDLPTLSWQRSLAKRRFNRVISRLQVELGKGIHENLLDCDIQDAVELRRLINVNLESCRNLLEVSESDEELALDALDEEEQKFDLGSGIVYDAQNAVICHNMQNTEVGDDAVSEYNVGKSSAAGSIPYARAPARVPINVRNTPNLDTRLAGKVNSLRDYFDSISLGSTSGTNGVTPRDMDIHTHALADTHSIHVQDPQHQQAPSSTPQVQHHPHQHMESYFQQTPS